MGLPRLHVVLLIAVTILQCNWRFSEGLPLNPKLRMLGKTSSTHSPFLLKIDSDRFVRLCKTAIMLYRQHQFSHDQPQPVSGDETHDPPDGSEDIYSWLHTITKQSQTAALDNFGCSMLRHLEEPKRILDAVIDFFVPAVEPPLAERKQKKKDTAETEN